MLTLLLCQDQSAGTDEILKRIAQDVAREQPGRILIVPELISHDIERRLCTAAGDTASRFAQVLTFSRLASRIAETAGFGAEQCMDNGGRIVAMAAAVRSLSSRLKAYASVETKPEFLAELLDAVDEFKRCCIAPGDLQRASEAVSQENSLFAQKLSELSMVLEAYDAICAQGKRDPRDLMTWVLHQLLDGDFGENHVFYIDGFPDYTRQHMAILEHLIHASANVTVSLNCDIPGSHAMAFEKAGATALELIRMANDLGVEYKLLALPQCSGPLQTVRTNLFQGKTDPVSAPSALRLYRADSPYEECQLAAQTIRQLVSSGCRYRDIAVVCTDTAAYRASLRLVFRRSGIPLYLAGTEDVLQSGVMSTVLSALDAALDGLEQRSTLGYLRSSLSPVSLRQCDMLENYVIVWGISGKRWLEKWTGHPDGLSGRWDDHSKEVLQQINATRQTVVEPLLSLRQKLQKSDLLRDKITALYEFLEETAFAARLQALAAELEADGDFRGAQICSQLWEILLCALEQLYDVLGGTAWDNENFTRLLRLLLSQYDVGTIPPVLDAVTAGNVSAMRCQREKHLILLGAGEGKLPGYSGSAGVLTDLERVTLRSLGVPLTGGSLEGLQSEFAEIFGVFCGAEESVTVTCSEEPSFVYRRLCHMAGGLETQAKAVLSGLENDADAAEFLVAANAQKLAEESDLQELYHRIRNGRNYKMGMIRPENIEKLYGKQLNLSASQVDRQAECRLSYFLQYGLRAKERKEARVDPAEFGTYVHSVLEHTAKEVMTRGGFRQVDLETTLSIAQEASDAYCAEHFSQLDSQRMEYLFRRNMQELEMIVRELWREMHESEYLPSQFELNFATDGQMNAIRITDAAIPASLRGFVDRVDLWQHAGASYVRVVDYKTGKKDFDYCDVFNGVGLQMLLYLFALEENGEAITGPKPVPAGVQYFPARVPYVTAQSPNDDTWEKERRKQWVRKGLLLRDDASIAAMDPSEKLDTLGCKRSKDGDLSGDLADRGQMLQLKHYVMQVLKNMVDEIASGNVQPNPYTRGTVHDACTFCPYGDVCHKRTVEGRRNYQTMSAQRFWDEIGKELESNG